LSDSETVDETINRLEAENERLRDRLQVVWESNNDEIVRLYGVWLEAEAELERLRVQVERLKIQRDSLMGATVARAGEDEL
jgi:hypothetical protein